MDKLSNMVCMNADHPKWQQVVDAAKELGARDWAIRKWAQRGTVPPKWQVQIVRETDGKIALSDFNESEVVQ